MPASLRANRRRGAGPETRVTSVSFTPSADRRSALDRAHRGDIEGALGRVPSFDTGPRHSLGRRIMTLLAIMGPGVVVMAANNDAGSLAIWAQAGQDHSASLLWLLVGLAPILFVIQEMVARLGAVTGAGHARLIFERFGRRWGTFALADLLVLNLVTIVTEFIGVSLALGYFGVSRFVSVPVAALSLAVVTSTGSFRRWERAMYLLVLVSLAVVPLLALTQHHPGITHLASPRSRTGLEGSTVLFVVAIVGTVVGPWQLFFQQSTVIDKRITARWLSYERIDTLIGSLLFLVGAFGVLLACSAAFGGTGLHGGFVDAGHVATGLRITAGTWAGALFALVLLNGSILGAAAVTLATSYAIGDVFGVKHSLHRGWRDAPAFHGSFVVCVGIAAAVVLIPGAPLGVVTVGVQALAGVLLPGATVFLLLLCNDRAVLGPRTNPRWLNALATLVVGVLIVLSALLMLGTLFHHIDVPVVATVLTVVLGVAFAAFVIARPRPEGAPPFEGTTWERVTWTMPPLETLPPPLPSRARSVGLIVLRSYLVLATVLLVAKVAQLVVRG
jgi:Mn2+/Fe2+ NRAMP family transporter